MKKKYFAGVIALLTMTAMIAAGCGKTSEGAGEAPVASDNGGASESASMASENAGMQLANPWRAATDEEIDQITNGFFNIPEGATNLKYSAMDIEGSEYTLLQATFDLDGLDYTARVEYGAEEYADISGMNYEWTSTDEGKLAGWGYGNMDAKFYRYVGDECVDLCTWYDIEIGIAYSLSTVAKDLEGFDIQAVVESMYPGDEVMLDDFIKQAAQKETFESYDEVISYLTKGQGYAYIKVKGYDGDVLAVTDYVYKNDDKTNATIQACLYGKVGDKVKNLGYVSTAGTAYPLALGAGGELYACNPHSYEVLVLNPEGTGLMYKDDISESYDPAGNATYSGFTRETNNADNTVEFTGGEEEYNKYWENYFNAEVINFTVVE